MSSILTSDLLPQLSKQACLKSQCSLWSQVTTASYPVFFFFLGGMILKTPIMIGITVNFMFVFCLFVFLVLFYFFSFPILLSHCTLTILLCFIYFSLYIFSCGCYQLRFSVFLYCPTIIIFTSYKFFTLFSTDSFFHWNLNDRKASRVSGLFYAVSEVPVV